jgi:hypothetical protein
MLVIDAERYVPPGSSQVSFIREQQTGRYNFAPRLIEGH